MNRVFFIERSVFVRFDALCQRLLGTFRDGLVRYSSILPARHQYSMIARSLAKKVEVRTVHAASSSGEFGSEESE